MKELWQVIDNEFSAYAIDILKLRSRVLIRIAVRAVCLEMRR